MNKTKKHSKVGQGWDYSVFNSITPGRVVKVLNPIWKQLWFRKFAFWRIFYMFLCRTREEHMQATIEKIHSLGSGAIFGNPRFHGSTYTQDKLITLRDYLKSSTEEQSLRIIEKFCEFHQKCWKLGFSNKDFKFSSYGVNADGDIMIIDISEMVFSGNEIKIVACSKKWFLSFDFGRLPVFLKKHYVATVHKTVKLSFGKEVLLKNVQPSY